MNASGIYNGIPRLLSLPFSSAFFPHLINSAQETGLICFFIILFHFPKGKAIVLTWSVKNYGMGVTAYDAWYDRVYLSKDNNRGCIYKYYNTRLCYNENNCC